MRYAGSTPILILCFAAFPPAFAQVVAPDQTPSIPFRQALQLDAPVQTGIGFTATLTPSPTPAVAYKIDRRTLHYQPDSSGKLIARLDCAAFQYDAAGKLLQKSALEITSTIDPEYAEAQSAPTPISARQPIPLRSKATTLVLAVRDASNGSLGNLQLTISNDLGATFTNDEPPTHLTRRTPEAFAAQQLALRHITLDLNLPTQHNGLVPNLQPQDVTLLDNGRPQPLTSFAAIDHRVTPNPTEVILLFDVMNATFQNIILERQGIEQYLRRNDGNLTNPVTIVYLSDAGVKINQPSRDGNVLAGNIEKLAPAIRLWDSAKAEGGWEERFRRSLRALNQLSTYEATKPGRKLLVWIGPGWPLLSGPEANISLLQRTRFFNSIVEVNTRLRNAHINLSSIETLNLSQGADPHRFLYQTFLRPVAHPDDADAPNLGLQVLAHQTGGQVLIGDGDIAAQIARCVDDSAFYYELTYTAPAATQPNELHTIEVKLASTLATTATPTPRTLQLFYLQP